MLLSKIWTIFKKEIIEKTEEKEDGTKVVIKKKITRCTLCNKLVSIGAEILPTCEIMLERTMQSIIKTLNLERLQLLNLS